MLVAPPTLSGVKGLDRETERDLDELRGRLTDELAGGNDSAHADATAWLDALQQSVRTASHAAEAIDNRFLEIERQAESLSMAMDFGFLFNPQRRLFAIGYNAEDEKLDRAHYDMLCSEARLASYLAIAKGDVESRHWFQLGRQLTQTAGQAALLSWGGTMFEYLMPQLFQRDFEGSLLRQSCRAAVARQQQYGRQHGVPWGVSESAFGALAANSDYHYRSFGVPGLGLKRGLAKDLVVSPYSTMLALEIDVEDALRNLEAIAQEGGMGTWGFYDAIDYTPQRVPPGRRSVIVRCYMAHHQGMSLLAMANLLMAGGARRRFHSHAWPRAGELLLQERVPVAAPRIEPHADELAVVGIPRTDDEPVSRRITGVQTVAPRTHLLANGRYCVMLTNTGGGYSRWRDLAISRWRPDATRDAHGQFIYLRDLQTQRVWSATYQPTRGAVDTYEVTYSIDKAEFHRRDGDLETHLEVAVSPENDAEVRQLTITNHGSATRHLELTSYLEVALNTQAADVAHPAFHKLFIETEYIPEETALLARRRPRDGRQPPLYAVHALARASDAEQGVEFETSREEFLGRGRSAHRPAALEPGRRLTCRAGAVLDPVFALRCTIRIRPHESATIGFTTAVASNREEAIVLADQYHDIRGVQRAFELAWAFNQVQLRHLHISPANAHLYQRLTAALLYPDPERRGSQALMLSNTHGQRGLWRYGISGDLPLLLLHVTTPEHIATVRELLMAQAYWQSRGLLVDLVVLNDHPGSYVDSLQEQLITLLNEWPRRPDERTAGAFLVRGAQLLPEDKALLEISASVVMHGEDGTLAQQWEPSRAHGSNGHQRLTANPEAPGGTTPAPPDRLRLRGEGPKSCAGIPPLRKSPEDELEFWNGLGGFAHGGREYHIRLPEGAAAPSPWSNVIANPRFGTLVTESGAGYTWFINSRENKLTSWSNDPISDPPSEALFVVDPHTGEAWSPYSCVLRDRHDYAVHHGQGYSRYLRSVSDIDHELLISIAPDDPVKFICLRLRNRGSTPRELEIAYYVEWVLGVCREHTQLFVQTERDPATGSLLARNSFHPDLPAQVAFLHVLGGANSLTGDRTEFIGWCRDLNHPQGLGRRVLSGRTGLGLDPCGAVRVARRLAAGEEAEVVFLLGAAENAQQAADLLARYGDASAVHEACKATVARWNETLEAIQIKTPDRACDLLVNRWLLYQTLSCRVWGRSAFYQSGGAFGFRDQLQDVAALVYSDPAIAREHLLRAASRQFPEGDVQHWWHVPGGYGMRTRFSDDYLWLPWATCHYVQTTGDAAVLDEMVTFVHSPPLESREQERYEAPATTDHQASLYEHCRRALDRGFRTGPHGLPLIGCGDWNDGLNRVGELGQGESVWVAWFLLVILRDFCPLMADRGEGEAARQYQQQADALRQAIEAHAWDGQWYLRAFFDDGTPLGSARQEECQIDSIAQTWAVFAEAPAERTGPAMMAVKERLVRPLDKLVLLLAPPFDKCSAEPGYIKGYLPGIRENGGQYTHPALWVIQALARQGNAAEAHAVLQMINPIHHAATSDDVDRYRVEPYVVAADVYGVPPHTGRGGWTWYTGSAAWMYRVIVESLLGFQQRGHRLTIRPQIPASWPGFEITYRRGRTTWNIVVRRREGNDPSTSAEVRDAISLVDDGGTHEVVVEC
jgi:cyclic beta-1,2-glucan synthetase